jgi:hypothetical protein
MRLAYLVLAHEQPRHLRRLVEALSSTSSAVFIHIDRKSRLQDFTSLAGPSVHIAPERVPVYRYHFSHVEAALILLRLALDDPRRFEYLLLLSGTDYPLQPATYIEEFLERRRGTEFMNIVRMPCAEAGKPTWRLATYKPDPGRPRIVNDARRILVKLGVIPRERNYREHLKDLAPYGGSEWWALTREGCQYMRDFASDRRDVLDFFRNVHSPQESFYHTVIGNSPFASSVARNLTYTDWSAGGASPAWLGEEHIELFGSTPRLIVNDVYGSGEVLFARKFSDRTGHLVDQLDRVLEARAAKPTSDHHPNGE